MSSETKTNPFYANTTREERQDWFTRTPPWNRVASTVIDAILDGITDKVLLEAFVLTSMENGLVARYEPLGRDDSGSPEIIRAQISQILCLLGNRTIATLAQAMAAKQTDTAITLYRLVHNTFEPAIALAKNQVVAYAGLAAAYGLVGKRAECQDYAKRGLVELAEMRGYLRGSTVFTADVLDQMERQLRGFLEN